MSELKSAEDAEGLETGLFVFSWDFELAWGFHDQEELPTRFHRYDSRRYLNEIIDIIDNQKIPTTWATVGHLLIQECSPVDDIHHPDMPRPSEGWYTNDPGTNVDTDPLWYATDVISRLLDSSSNQEIACHTFSHVTTNVDSNILRAELQQSQTVAPSTVTLQSFISPRHYGVPCKLLSELNYTSYRDPTSPPPLRRAVKFYTGLSAPPTDIPERDEYGLWRIPTSTYFFYEPLHRVQKSFPIIKRRWLQSGLERAAEKKEVFHVWAHPHNFIGDERAISQFRWLMRQVRKMADQGRIVPVTISQISNNIEGVD